MTPTMKRLMFASMAVTAVTLARVTIATAEVITLYCTNGRYLTTDQTTYLPMGDPDTTVVIDTQARTVNNVPAYVFDENKIIYRFEKDVVGQGPASAPVAPALIWRRHDKSHNRKVHFGRVNDHTDGACELFGFPGSDV